jgi:hypothetical protein
MAYLAVEKVKTWRLFKNGEMPGAKKVQGRSVLPVREGLNFLNKLFVRLEDSPTAA